MLEGRVVNNRTPGPGQIGRGGGGGSPYEVGYMERVMDPYIRDSGRPETCQQGRGSSLDASRGLHGHGPYNPRLTRGGGLPPYPKDLKRAIRELDVIIKIKSNLNGGNGLLGMTDSYKHPIQVAKQFHPREDFMSPASTEVKRVIPKTEVTQWKKLQDKLDDTKKDLLDAEEDKEEAEGDNVDPATVQDDKQKADELLKEIAKIPKLFVDVGTNPTFSTSLRGNQKLARRRRRARRAKAGMM